MEKGLQEGKKGRRAGSKGQDTKANNKNKVRGKKKLKRKRNI